jgi:hypothetical protein
MRYTEKDRTGMIWSKFVSAWTFANIVLKSINHSMKITPSILRRIQNGVRIRCRVVNGHV